MGKLFRGALSALFLASALSCGCNSLRISERDIDEAINSDERCQQEKIFPKLHCNSLAAYLGRFGRKISSKEIMENVRKSEVIARVYGFSEQEICFFRDEKGWRGDLLLDNLEKQLRNEDMKKSLLIVFVGGGHSVRAEARLKNFNTYFFLKILMLPALMKLRKICMLICILFRFSSLKKQIEKISLWQ